MERTLFSFIWKYSKREQIVLLLVTLATFPALFATLELPKRIINDAIAATTDQIMMLGVELTQVQFLLALCIGFLVAVIVHGIMKMRLNTMKGIVAERLLRRFRFDLISHMMRFPKPYFRNTSQGELVSMITSEAEPMGGLMGDAVAQPVFQAGQMLTILVFLFLQSFWFGLAAVMLIPLQAWLIPMLQRQINLLNKSRVIEVRQLSAEIGETAAGISDLRVNGGVRFRLASFSARLGRLFDIRFQIYQKKFFMKFLNNFITQLTPFFFYSVGGYLAIKGDITVGALVAALAAYKDLSNPWKELLTYYNQVQDMSLRWEIVTERFAPKGLIDEALFEGEPDSMPRLSGAISLKDVTVRDADGNLLLEDINLEIPPGARVGIRAESANERAAFADLLTREILPSRGTVTLSGHPLSELHQAVIAGRIGYAHSRPYIFDGTLGETLLMSLRTSPQTVNWDPHNRDRDRIEAHRSGNSTDPVTSDWLDPSLAGLTDDDDVNEWWFKLVQAMGIDESMFRRTLMSKIDPELHGELARRITDLRPEIHERLKEKGLDDAVHRMDPDKFNPSVPLGGNLLFSSPRQRISQQGLASNRGFIRIIDQEGLAEQGLEISQAVIEALNKTFGRDGTGHKLFQMLEIEEEMYDKLTMIVEKRRTSGPDSITAEERALLLTVPFAFSAEQIGPTFPQAFMDQILEIRKTRSVSLRERAGDMFVPIGPDVYLPRLTVMENALYGRISMFAGARKEVIEDLVGEVLAEHGMQRLVTETIFDLQTGIAGAKLPTTFHERAGFSRSAIKRPDILILDRVLVSHDAQNRVEMRDRMRTLLPDTTLIFMEDRFNSPENYDLFIELKDGRIDGIDRGQATYDDADDLSRKLKAISKTELFADLDRKSQRLLAFSAQWYTAKPDQVVFAEGQQPDGAYLCVKGRAELSFVSPDGVNKVVSTVEPGRLIGDLSIIMNETRQLDLTAREETTFLRIGATEYKAVIESDAKVAMSLLQTVARHLSGAAELLRTNSAELPNDPAPTPPPD